MATTNLTECVCVWLDETSEPGEATWVVSRDQLDAGGGAVTTRTLSSHHNEAAAVAEAEEQGRRLGLPVRRS